jgi:signal transduction histidine kinase
VDPAFAPALFDAFTRGPKQAGSAGSGLGLAISRRLAESFGARLKYRAREPQGSVFTLIMEAAE